MAVEKCGVGAQLPDSLLVVETTLLLGLLGGFLWGIQTSLLSWFCSCCPTAMGVYSCFCPALPVGVISVSLHRGSFMVPGISAKECHWGLASLCLGDPHLPRHWTNHGAFPA